MAKHYDKQFKLDAVCDSFIIAGNWRPSDNTISKKKHKITINISK